MPSIGSVIARPGFALMGRNIGGRKMGHLRSFQADIFLPLIFRHAASAIILFVGSGRAPTKRHDNLERGRLRQEAWSVRILMS
jgi:hypothetical protein